MSRYTALSYRRSRGFTSGLMAVLVLFMLATAAIAWVSTGIIARERWPIRWLEVNGSFQRVSAERLRSSLTPLISSSFFTIDLHALREAANRISWVSAVKVQKKWPDTVSVDVVEYVPVAHWNSGQLISDSGEAFAVPEADSIQGLPWLLGPEGQLGQVLENWSYFNDELAPAGMEIRRLMLSRRGAWSIDLDNGTHLKLGRDSALERLQRLIVSWDSLLQDEAAAPVDVDLRYTNGFAVQWSRESEDQTGKGS